MNAGDDTPRDPRLLEALRHAPDADAAPPPALSRAILRAAHEAVAPPGWGARTLAAWRWLARPPVAAGFASVMMATLVGLMWWGRPIDEARHEAPAPSATPAGADRADAKTAAPEPPVQPEAAVVAPVRVQAPPRAAPPVPTAAPERRREAAAVGPTPAEPAAPEPAPAPTRTAVAEALADVAGASAATPTTPAIGAARSGAPERPEAATLARPADPTLAALRGALRAAPLRYRWQHGTGPERAPDDALQAWLARADAARAGPWQPATDAPGRDPLAVLRIDADDGSATLLTLAPGALWLDAGGRRLRAALVPGQAETLRDTLP